MKEWTYLEMESEAYMGLAVSMGKAYTAVKYELYKELLPPIQLNEKYYFEYERNFIYFLFDAMTKGHLKIFEYKHYDWFLTIQP